MYNMYVARQKFLVVGFYIKQKKQNRNSIYLFTIEAVEFTADCYDINNLELDHLLHINTKNIN